jgi:DnaJ-class molecular chaperone
MPRDLQAENDALWDVIREIALSRTTLSKTRGIALTALDARPAAPAQRDATAGWEWCSECGGTGIVVPAAWAEPQVCPKCHGTDRRRPASPSPSQTGKEAKDER